MQPLLFLAHRIPFPPNKGDKIRSYHLLRHLASHYAIHLGTFVDDPADRAHVQALGMYCASIEALDIDPKLARVRALSGLLSGEALTVPYYRTPVLRRWVERTVGEHGIERCVVFSSAMAQFVAKMPALHTVVDFCDVDSAKWTQYAAMQRWPSSSLYRREGERLLAYERAVAARSAASVFATRAEAALFRRLAPDAAQCVHVIENGVDNEVFRPDPTRPIPFAVDEEPIVFTGAMDYWPNADAACWFATEVLPLLAQHRPAARFYVVGMNPGATVAALARDPRVVITGRVPDVRPYVQHARLVVAPLRVARGIQNKVLEAMAMARPVLVSAASADGIVGTAGVDFAVADGAAAFAARAQSMLADPAAADAMAQRARQRIVAECNWSRNLTAFDKLLDGPARATGAAGTAAIAAGTVFHAR